MKLKYQLAVQQVMDFWAAVPVGKDSMRYNGVMSLNETSKDIIELLKEETTEEEIVKKMLEEYDVTGDVLRKHVSEFLDKLREEKLLVE